MKTLLIVATNTDAGKTVLTTSLVAYWQTFNKKQSLGLIKLLQTGVGDRELYERLFADSSSIEIVNPLSFSAPLAPPIAAAKEGRSIDLAVVWQALKELQQKHELVLAEALGGLGSPVTEELTVADLARDWCLPVLLVVPVKLGSIADAVANVALARQSNLDLRGIVLNCLQPEAENNLQDWASIDSIESLTGVNVVGVIPYLSEPTNVEKLTRVAANLDLEMFFV
jgi:dethiobiotin synthetase